VTKKQTAKSRARKKASPTRRRKQVHGPPLPEPPQPSPPEADIPKSEYPIGEAPGHLRRREEAFKRRRGIKT
jgi:hypothetical protein